MTAAHAPTVEVGTCQRCKLTTISTRQHTCGVSLLAGLACTCPPGCTRERVGDGATCKPDCEPCRLFAGVLHRDVVEWRRERKPK